jgi:hypothetical protein
VITPLPLPLSLSVNEEERKEDRREGETSVTSTTVWGCTSHHGLSDLVRQYNKSVEARPLTEIILLHFSSSMGWN